VQTLLSLQSLGVPARQEPAEQTSFDVHGLPSSQDAVLLTKPHPVVAEQNGEVQGLLSSGHTVAVPPVQAPLRQASPVVQSELSLHGVPASAFANTQPVTELQPSMVQALPSEQTLGEPPWQVPPAQTSPTVQAFESLQGAVLSVHAHAPVDALQVSVVQTLLSLQSLGVPARQVPAEQTSFTVHGLPSSQAAVLLTKPHPVVAEQNGEVHGFESSGQLMVDPTQTPLLQTSPLVQAELSLQGVPASAFENTQPVVGLQPSVVHALESEHTRGAPAWHAPPAQTSPTVQAFESLQAAVLLVQKQAPVDGLHASSVHPFASLQFFGAPARQVPAEQTSFTVQPLPSSHGAVLVTKPHPVEGVQMGEVQTFESSGQVTAVPRHEPAPLQTSAVVHSEPSLQGVPASTPVNRQPNDGLHESAVQTLLSLHTMAAPPRQAPPLQTSPDVQAFPSLQDAVLFVHEQAPSTGLHTSSVHTFASPQFFGVPALQVPAEQLSLRVQALPSSHGAVLLTKPQPSEGEQLGVVHAFESSGHVTAEPVHRPAPLQASPVVQSDPSSQASPGAAAGKKHPVDGLHAFVVHALPSSQTRGEPL